MSRRVVPAEIYSRVSGYFRPLAQWNKGKKEEFVHRKGLRYSSATREIEDAAPLLCENNSQRS
jgi:hypothetical protein